MRKFIESYYFETEVTKNLIPIPFGLNRKKVEMLFYKIESLERNLPANESQVDARETNPPPRPKKLDEKVLKEGAAKVAQVLNGDAPSLDFQNAQDLYRMMK